MMLSDKSWFITKSLDDWLTIRDERGKRNRDELRIGKLMAQLVALDEPELSEEYAELSKLLSKLSLKRGCFNLNGVLKSYSESVKSRALALVFNLVETSSMQYLLLRNNAIESRTLQNALSAFNADPRGQRKLLRLKTLDLSNNRLGASGVKTFSESEVSGVETLASGLGKGWFPALQELRLSGNDIKSSGFQALATSFNTGNVSLLKILDLGNNDKFPFPLHALAEALTLGSLPDLEELHLSRCDLGSDSFTVYADAIRSGHLPQLKVLDLDFSESYTGSEGAKYLAEAMTSSAVNNTLREIDLSGTWIYDAGVCALAASLEVAESRKLQVLRLCDTGMRTKGLQGITRAVTNGNLQSLEVLDLSSNSLSQNKEAVRRFAKSLPRLTRLRELYLQGTGMETKGLWGITAAINSGNLQSLEVLNLSSNNLFSDEALRSFAESLRHLSWLKKLYLQNIKNEAEKVLQVTQVLEQGGFLSLEVLDLSVNESLPENFRVVAGLAESFRHIFMRLKIRELRIKNVGLRDGGLTEIAKAKEGGLFDSLEVLDLSFNFSIGDAGVLALVACRFKKLKDLLLSGTRVGDEGLQRIVKAFASGHLPSLELVDVRKTRCTKKTEISSRDENDLMSLILTEKVIRRECSEKIAGRVLREKPSEKGPLQQDIRYRYAMIMREDEDFDDQGTQILDLNEEVDTVDGSEDFDQDIQRLDLSGKGKSLDEDKDFVKGAQILDLKSEEAKIVAQSSSWPMASVDELGSYVTGGPSSTFTSSRVPILDVKIGKAEAVDERGSSVTGGPSLSSAPTSVPVQDAKREKAENVDKWGSSVHVTGGPSSAGSHVSKEEDLDQQTEMLDSVEQELQPLQMPKGAENVRGDAFGFIEANPVHFVHATQLPVPPIGPEDLRSNVLDLNEEAEQMDCVEGPQLLEQFTWGENVRLDLCASGAEVEVEVDVGNTTIYSSRSQLRPDIQFMGFTSFKDQFNPDRILFVYDVVMPIKRVEMAFFHTEGMASLFGIGLPFSKVLVEVDFKITIQEMPELSWYSLWNDSYDRSFKPMFFQNCVENVTSASSPNNFDLSTDEALRRFGVAMEGKNHYKLRSARLFNKDESNISNFGTGWRKWFNKLRNTQKLKGEGSTEKMEIDDGRREHLSPTTSQAEVGNTSNVASKEEVNKGDVRLVVHVAMNHERSQLYEYKREPTSPDTEEYGPDLEPVDRNRIAKDYALSNCYIKPMITFEFFCNNHPDVNEVSKNMEARLLVHYQFASNFNNHRNLNNLLKFGWYQKNLQLSFKCRERHAATIDIDALKINSSLENSNLEYMTNTSQSHSSSRGRNVGLGAKIGPGKIAQGQLQIGLNTEFEGGSSHVDQEVQQTKLICLAEAPSFAINNKGVRDELAYEALLWRDMKGQKLWDPSERCKAAATSGMFSTVSVDVQGSWRLNRNDIQTHIFQAEKVLQQHCRDNINVLDSTDEILEQQFLQNFSVNHSFSHFANLKRAQPYDWVLVEGDEKCPAHEQLH